ncbi:hypothetical protein [Lacrimispora indolis]|uniref:hypothetical protein n=1 Tax=Lacrimispora indolis TaxID=69825 RepID=UPI00356B01CC
MMENIYEATMRQKIYDIGSIAADLQIEECRVATAAGMSYPEYQSQKSRLIADALESWLQTGVKKVLTESMGFTDPEADQRMAAYGLKERLESCYLKAIPEDLYDLAADVVSVTNLIGDVGEEGFYVDCRTHDADGNLIPEEELTICE